VARDLTRYPLYDARHALYAGCVVALALQQGLALEPLMDAEGNYTAEFMVTLRPSRADAIVVTLVIPPPSDDWRLSDWIGA